MKSAFEKWVESKYGDSLMVPSGAVAAWNAAVEESLRLIAKFIDSGPDAYRNVADLEEDFQSEGG